MLNREAFGSSSEATQALFLSVTYSTEELIECLDAGYRITDRQRVLVINELANRLASLDPETASRVCMAAVLA